MKKLLLIITLSLLLSGNAYAQSKSDKKFEKDLKKISKDNGFVDNLRKVYSVDNISDKKNTILIVYTHGSLNDQTIDKCSKNWNKVPPIISNLHNKKVKDFKVKIYYLCSGVRGWTKNHWKKMSERYKNVKKANFSKIIKDDFDKIKFNGAKQFRKQKVIINKVDELINLGFENIILAGHSAGGWASITLKSKYPNKIPGAIAINPAFAGKINNRREWKFWELVRNYGVSQIDLKNLNNTIIYVHDKDGYETPKTLSFLNLNTVVYKDISKSTCKPKLIFGKHHGIPLTKCFAEKQSNANDVINFLEKTF
jgi:predicted alpha/beta hydrolase family esterase